jgi:CheY-like chemotaxis protein
MSLPKDPTGHFLEILVQDEGIGIAPEDAGRLFTMFSQVDSSITREVEGTGLGLALVDQLARLAGGTVALSSTPDEGASFYVWLPWRDSPVPEEEAKSAVPSSSSSRAQPVTLVIEDNDLAAQLIRIQLEEEGFRVNRVATARAALVWMSEGAPDLIILDLVLPDMDGWDLLVQLKGPKSPVAHVPVVIVSIVADAPRGIALGAAAAVTKPYLRDELLAALNEAGFATGAQEEGRLVAEVHRALELAP